MDSVIVLAPSVAIVCERTTIHSGTLRVLLEAIDSAVIQTLLETLPAAKLEADGDAGLRQLAPRSSATDWSHEKNNLNARDPVRRRAFWRLITSRRK